MFGKKFSILAPFHDSVARLELLQFLAGIAVAHCANRAGQTHVIKGNKK